MKQYTEEEARNEGEWMQRAAEWHADRKQPLWKKALNMVTFHKQETEAVDYQTAEYILGLAAVEHMDIPQSDPQLYIRVLAGEIDFSTIDTRVVSFWPESQPIIG